MIEENISILGESEETAGAWFFITYNAKPDEVDADGFLTEEDVWGYVEGFDYNSANFDSDVATITVVIN